MKRIIGFLKDDEGASSVEYSILAAAIAAVIVTAAIAMGVKVQACFQAARSAWP